MEYKSTSNQEGFNSTKALYWHEIYEWSQKQLFKMGGFVCNSFNNAINNSDYMKSKTDNNNNLQNMGKLSWPNLRYYPQHLIEGTEKNNTKSLFRKPVPQPFNSYYCLFVFLALQPTVVVFYSPVAGFSLLVFEVS
jgi:hypothetical protein